MDRSAKAAFFFLFAVLAAAVTIAPAQAQTSGAQTVQAVAVEGNVRIEAETVASYLVIGPGDPVDQSLLDLSLKTLFRTGLFADVNLRMEGGTLVVAVRENPIVNRVLFEGNKRLKEDKFTEEIQLAPRIVYTRAKVQADVQRIIEVYRRSGRFGATVDPKVTPLEQNRVDVIFEIDEGPTTKIGRINFIGNQVYTDDKLRDTVLTSESSWWNFFEANDNYDPDRLEYDQELLRQHYSKNGYADFQVVSAIAELTPERDQFIITFTVDEGPQYEVGDITVQTTLEKLDPERLKSFIPIREGATFNSERVDDAVDAITFATGVTGYAFVDVRPRLNPNPQTRKIDILFQVNEGPRVYVERINIKGNTRTLDRIVRREMRVSEGDAFNRVLIDRSRQRIRALGYFGDVAIEETPGSTPDRTVVDVNVQEQSTGSFSIGAGVSSVENFIADISIEERNLLGRGQFMRFRISSSSRRRQIDIRFTEPYFLDRNLAAGFELFNVRTDFRESDFESTSTGVGLNMGFPLSEYSRMGLRYTIRQDNTEVDEDRLGCTSSATGTASLRSICQSVGDRLTSLAGYTLSFDRRNDPIEPSRGWRAVWSQDVAGLGGDVKYLRSEFRGSIYRPLPGPFVGAFHTNAGYIDGWGDDDVRLNDRFFRGASSFRGFEVAGVGPRDIRPEFNDSLGGKAYAIGTAEIIFPLPLPDSFRMRASLFTEFGAVGLLDEADKLANEIDLYNNTDFQDFGFRDCNPLDSDDCLAVAPDGIPDFFFDYDGDGIPDDPIQDEFSLRATYGVSLNWDSPFGPIQLDFAQTIQREEYDETEGFRFSAGTRF
ncbi:MAG: outer membrane protein assembly factor BamA [Pseudomonadota bacterium]